MLDAHKVNYVKYTIVQVCNLKDQLERINLIADNVMLMSLDIVNMYLLIQVHLIQKALDYYTRKLPASSRKAVRECMEMDRYYKYNGVAEDFTNTFISGIYRDDGLVVSDSCQSPREIRWWLECFQQQINRITCGTYLQFTTKIDVHWHNVMAERKMGS
eukprot:5900657-Ditylum_brightwellii.AAC.1